MAVLRPAATLSKPFLITTWVKQEDSAELAEQASLWRRRGLAIRIPESSGDFSCRWFGIFLMTAGSSMAMHKSLEF
jgi:hypothetical protein